MSNTDSYFTCPIADKAISIPDTIAVTDGEKEISYTQCHCLIDQKVRNLKNIGISKSHRVAFLSANSIEFIIHIFALMRIGASFVPINLRWSRETWQKIVKETECKTIFADSNHYDLANSLDLEVYQLRNEMTPEDLEKGRADENLRDLDLESEVSVIYTSGSSGSPKGVRLSNGNFYFNALGSNQNIPLVSGDTWLASTPFFHVSGLAILFRCFLAGKTVFVTNDLSSDSLQKCLTGFKITHISLVPVQLEKIIEDNPSGLNDIKCVLLGGAHINKKLIEKCIQLQLPVYATYGMTETASQIATTSIKDAQSKMGAAVKPLPYLKIRIENEKGDSVASPNVGQIAIRGKVVFKGYLSGDSENTDHTWFRTGDYGFLDNDGYLHLVGRKDDMIISGGENIYPEEIEKVANRFPGIKNCVVIGVENKEWGERPFLFIEKEKDHQFSLDQLNRFLRTNLVKLHVPDEVFMVEEIPRTPIGKFDKEKLKQLVRSQIC
ncbi:o-succinylbenzoate--CoA ligase [candidate division KSB1 bacterium]|nr:o-succinylbenzoate--CoA ligase [candidate division KSB1 bacterium]